MSFEKITKSSKQVTLRGLVFPLDFIEMDIFEIKIKRRKSKKVFATTIRNLFTLTNYVEQSVSVMFDWMHYNLHASISPRLVSVIHTEC